MRLSTCAVVVLLIAGCRSAGGTSLAKDDSLAPPSRSGWSCIAADEGNSNRVPVPVNELAGAVVVDPQKIDYNGVPIAVVYNSGSSTEPQTMLSMKVGNAEKLVYDVPNALHQVNANGVFLQCYNTNQAGQAQRLSASDIECSVDYDFNQDRAGVDLTIMRGAADVETDYQVFRDGRFAVEFHAGSEFEPQQLLKLRINDQYSAVYDPAKNLNTFRVGKYRMQCFASGGGDTPQPDEGGMDAEENMASWTCTASNYANTNRQLIGVYETTGAVDIDTAGYTYDGHTVVVHSMLGDQYDSQSLLKMSIDDVYGALVYDPTRSLYAIKAAGVWLQCYYESGTNPRRMDAERFRCGGDWDGNQERVDMTPVIRPGSAPDQPVVSFRGYNLSALLDMGTPQESQQMTSIKIADNVELLAYDPSPGSLFMAIANEMRIQCWSE